MRPEIQSRESRMLGQTLPSAKGQWVLVNLQVPGSEITPVGIILLDLNSNALSVVFRQLTPQELTEDIADFWDGFEELLRETAQDIGGEATLSWIESVSSHTIQVGTKTTVDLYTPERTAQSLFEEFVRPSGHKFHFSREALNAAIANVPTLPSSSTQILAAMNNPQVSSREIEMIVARDPVIAAHLIRIANSAAMPFSGEVRSLAAAIQRIGFSSTKLHVLALTIGKMFSSARLKKIWVHSIDMAQATRQLARKVSIPADEASLLGLIHDVGQIALHSLGMGFEEKYVQLQHNGLTDVAIERELCAVDHAILGGQLLTSWRFPSDFIEAVQTHHSQDAVRTKLSALLFVAEAGCENNEDVYDIHSFHEALRVLGIAQKNFSVPKGLDADLRILRAAA